MSEDKKFVSEKDAKVEEMRSKGFDFVEDEYEENREAYNDRFQTVRGSQKDLYQKYAETFVNPYPEVPCPQEALDGVKNKNSIFLMDLMLARNLISIILKQVKARSL